MPTSRLRALAHKSVRLSQVMACALNQWLNRFDDKLFVIGEGRSGTTWLANLLNFDDHYRVLFEPFLTENFRPPLTYASEYPFPDSGDSTAVHRHVQKALRGNFISGFANVRFPKALYRGLLIKDISAQLIIDPICEHAPTMKKVMIFRHPFAVTASKSKIFKWPTDPMTFLSASNPRRDEITEFAGLIEETAATRDFVLIQVLLWCLSYRYAMASKSISTFTFVFYEDLVAHPKRELPRIFSELGLAERYETNKAAILRDLDQESHVTFRNNTIEATRLGKTVWHDEWETRTIDAALRIVDTFGFSRVYSERLSPVIEVEDLRKQMAALKNRSIGNQH